MICIKLHEYSDDAEREMFEFIFETLREDDNFDFRMWQVAE